MTPPRERAPSQHETPRRRESHEKQGLLFPDPKLLEEHPDKYFVLEVFDREKAMRVVRALQPNHLVGAGNFSLGEKAERLFDAVSGTGNEDRVLGELNICRKNPREFAYVLQALDYSMVRDSHMVERNRFYHRPEKPELEQTLDALENARKEGPLNLEVMRGLLEVGYPFTDSYRGISLERIQGEHDRLNSLSGEGRNAWSDADLDMMPRTRDELIDALHHFGIERTRLRGGRDGSITRSHKKQLQAIYFKELQRRRVESRKRERCMDLI
ncbi:MAG TPA: hypothetical protein ENN13_05630 [Candidatus Altiarchaeales archaeon]|nr:hypothetical protein [Candidatus Altiarchaeales archaeon]